MTPGCDAQRLTPGRLPLMKRMPAIAGNGQTTKNINQLPGPFAPSAQAEELLDPVPR
jgi:hypothetical protein